MQSNLRKYIKIILQEIKKEQKEDEEIIDEFSGCGSIVGAMVPPTPEQAKQNNQKPKPIKIA
jgi:hypothetical protein